MNKVIATIRLNSGQGNFYDELTRIHLTVGNPQADLIAGMNLSNIRNAVRSGRLIIVAGKLEDPKKPFRLVRKSDGLHIVANGKVSEDAVVPAKKEAPVEQHPKASEETTPEPAAVEPATEAPVEEASVTEETAEEKPKKRGGRKKKAAAAEEEK